MTSEKKEEERVHFNSTSNKIDVYCNKDTSLGEIHDFLVNLKGRIVDQIIKAQMDDEESNNALMNKNKKENEEETKESEETSKV